MEMLSTLRENSPSSKHLQDQKLYNLVDEHMPMAWQDYYSAAPWLSGARSLPSQVTKELFIAEAAPGQLAKRRHCQHVILGPVNLCMIKGDAITFF
jgi:hypothetical protein